MPLKLLSLKKIALTLAVTACLPIQAAQTLPNVELTGDLLYKIMASEFALRRNDPATAFQTYMHIARMTKDPRLAQRAFQIADGARSYDNALQAAELWKSIDPGDSDSELSAILSEMRLGRLTPQLSERAQTFLKNTKNANERMKYFQGMGLQCELSGRSPADILAFVEPLAALCKNKGEAALSLAKLYRRTGDRANAQKFAQKALSDMPDNSSAVLEYADAVFDRNPKEAIAKLEAFVKRHPKNFDVHLGLAKAYARNRDKAGVQKQILVLDSYAQNIPSFAFTLATVSDSVGLDTETKRYLLLFERLAKEQNVMLDRLPQVYLSLGMLDSRRKHYAAAQEWFENVEQDSEFYPQARLFLAQTLAEQNKVDQAIKVLRNTKVDKRLQLDFQHKEAQVYFDAGRFNDAYRAIRKALDLDQDNTALLFQTALIAEKLNRIDDAEKYLLKAIELAPDEIDLYNTLGYLWVDHNRNLDQAKVFIEKALAAKPDNAAYLDSMGWYYFRAGDLTQARVYLEKAAELLKDKEILMHLIEVYQCQGMTPQALSLARALLQNDPRDEEVNSLLDRLNMRF